MILYSKNRACGQKLPQIYIVYPIFFQTTLRERQLISSHYIPYPLMLIILTYDLLIGKIRNFISRIHWLKIIFFFSYSLFVNILVFYIRVNVMTYCDLFTIKVSKKYFLCIFLENLRRWVQNCYQILKTNLLGTTCRLI